MNRETFSTIDADLMLKVVGGVLLTVCSALAGWGLKTAVANADRITAIESNRFTRSDGLEALGEINERLVVIEQSLKALAEK